MLKIIVNHAIRKVIALNAKKVSASRITNANSAILQSACCVTNQVVAVIIAREATHSCLKQVAVNNASLVAMAVKTCQPASIVTLICTYSNNRVTINVSVMLTEDGSI